MGDIQEALGVFQKLTNYKYKFIVSHKKVAYDLELDFEPDVWYYGKYHPDIAFIGKRVAVFCDSEFWHGYDWENRRTAK